ncbi:MAG: 50S ribosomal protein L18 [Candidatus Lokiarchaeota archaeon]|nr:50S ribosomal protein L18 [Candidatus Lokiarchaeota archaeon]
MAKGPRYRKGFRRRVQGKTDYHKRLKLLKSRKLRVVIRASNNHLMVQIVQSKLRGDKVLVSAFSKELVSKYTWNANTGNLPASYLTGYLAGFRAKAKKINEGIFDLGIFYHRNRVLAACKGIIDAGMGIPYRKEFFPENLEERIKGSHIENYAKLLKREDPEKYEQIFSGYIKKQGIDPQKINQLFSSALKTIESKA